MKRTQERGWAKGYLTARETAERWGISAQAVALYAAGGRLPGARKQKGRWLIPADTAKPEDRRRRFAAPVRECQWWAGQPERSGFLYGPHALSAVWFPPGRADWVMSTVADPLVRAQLLGELCYLRGQFEEAAGYFESVRSAGRRELLVPAWFHTVENALHLSDWSMVLHGLSQLSEIGAEGRRCGDLPLAKAAELATDTFLIVCNAPERCQPWIKEGDFSRLPDPCLIDAAYARCKYLQNSGQTEQMLSEYRMATALIGDNPFWRGYPAVMALLGYSSTKQTQATEALASTICEELMADGFVIPMMDDLSHVGHSLLRYVQGGASGPVGLELRRLGQECCTNWADAVKLITGRDYGWPWSFKEMETMWLASVGMSNKEIAQHLNLSVNTVKLRLQTIYEKLHINSRKELGKFVYFG